MKIISESYKKRMSELAGTPIEQNNINILKEGSDPEYLKWKRKNVTLRGVSNPGEENGAGDMLGKGLYTAALGNKSMAKEYGQLHFVVGARPKNPLIFDTLNRWEIWFQGNLLKPYNYQRYKFNESTSIEKEVQKLGYDGIEIKGREIVNFTPPNDVKYFKNEQQLKNYYNTLIQNSSDINELRKIIREMILEVGFRSNDNLNVADKYNFDNNIDTSKPVYYFGTTKTKGSYIRKNGFFDEESINITTDKSKFENFEDIIKVRLKKGAKFTTEVTGLRLDNVNNIVVDYSETIPLINVDGILEGIDINNKVKVDFSLQKIFFNNKEVGNFEIYSSKDGKYLNLDKIFINKEFRGFGIANKTIEEILNYASKNNLITTVTPDSVWGSSVNKLIKWYKSLGFIMNTGKNKDFNHQYLMYKLP